MVRPMRCVGCDLGGDAWGPIVVAALGQVAGLTEDRLAAAAGCPVALVCEIAAGRLRPAWETLERLANSVGLELRVGVRAATGSRRLRDRFDSGMDRVRKALDAENAWRAGLGLSPLAPPAETVPPWDGTDPAPARQVAAWPHRTDAGGHAAINVRYGRNCVLGIPRASFAALVGLTPAELGDIEDGRVSLSLDDTECLLNRAGLEQFAHLELYDGHDDLLHLDAIAARRRRRAHVGSR